MAGETDISICSKALVRVGENTISALTDETERAVICANTWPALKQSILGMYPWKVSMAKKALNRLAAAPTNEYKYRYQLPSDRLLNTPYKVWADATEDTTPIRWYRVQQNAILTDEEACVIDYQIDVSEADFGPHLVELSVLALAAEIAYPITDSLTKAEYWSTKAWGQSSEKGRGGYYRTARGIDASSQPPQVVQDYTLVTVRNTGAPT
jgi:hypothetical protein